MNKTVIVASRWFLYYLTYIDDARSNTNQVHREWFTVAVLCETLLCEQCVLNVFLSLYFTLKPIRYLCHVISCCIHRHQNIVRLAQGSCMRPIASVVTALRVACTKHPDQAVLAPATPMSCTLT